MKKSIETILSHAGLLTDATTGAISTPIYQTATFGHPKFGHSTGFDYSRTSNPTRLVLEKIMAELEGGVGASAFSTGMAAIASLLVFFKPGDKVLLSNDLYGGTYRLFETIFAPWGLKTEYLDFSNLEQVASKVDPKVKAFFVETPTNPLMRITDLKKLIHFAQPRGIRVIVDNTFMTPYCQRPLELGADMVVHSGTKFLSGHNDTLCGVVVSRKKSVAEKIAFNQNASGGVLSPFDSWLVLRGLKTLAVRYNHAQANAQALAQWLERRAGVQAVYYPGLSKHSGYQLHKRQASGAGAVLSFKVKNYALAKRVINRVKTFTFAESLGGTESLITHPVSQTHADIPETLRHRVGVTQDLLRLSIGIEHTADLISDLDQAIG